MAAIAILATPSVVAAEKATHVLSLVGTTTRPAVTAAGRANEGACLLHVTMRRLTTVSRPLAADLTLEVADPREGRRGSLFGTVRLDLDDTGATRRTLRIDGIGCDDLRPLNLHFACAIDSGRCPAGTRVRLKNFQRLEIAEDGFAFD